MKIFNNATGRGHKNLAQMYLKQRITFTFPLENQNRVTFPAVVHVLFQAESICALQTLHSDHWNLKVVAPPAILCT